MKTFIASILIITALNSLASAQQSTTNSALAPVTPHKNHRNYDVLMVCYSDNGKDSVVTKSGSIAAIEQHSIKSMQIFKGDEATKRFGIKARDGIILLTLVKDSILLSTAQLLDKYKITRNDQKLPIYIDGNTEVVASDLYYSPSSIKTVTVKEKPEDKSKYIYVRTTNKYATNVR